MYKLTNDHVILQQVIRSRCAEADNELSEAEYFEIYSASEILKDHDLTYDDIKYGIVGDGGDGGIDSIFTFLNGELLKEDTTINANQKKNFIELTAEDLFNLSNNPQNYTQRYNQELISKVCIFRNAYEKLASNFPKLEISFYYATQGCEVHLNVSGKVPKLESDIHALFGGSTFNFEFIDAKRLLELTRDIPVSSKILEIAETPISTDDGSYVCLVTLDKYFEFICDSGSLARSIFEANVRDYQGSVTVNTGIKNTLSNPQSEDFWYLNNGVTIITPKAVSAGKKITIEDPQIVNGLQTSHEIYNYFSEEPDKIPDTRKILVRILCEENEEARDRIIRATNSQTSIPPASLRSSDAIHRNIEDFLKANDFYYDRKKNYYKNQNKPISKIISIPYMAQAMMAITLKKPDSARARPSTLINSQIDYKKIFSLDTPIDVYLKAIQIMKEVESFLKPQRCGIELPRKDITNIKFYIAMLVCFSITGERENLIEALSKLPKVNIDDEILNQSFTAVLNSYRELGGTDQIAKGPALVASLLS
jgi:hypothetical protein